MKFGTVSGLSIRAAGKHYGRAIALDSITFITFDCYGTLTALVGL